MSTLKDIAFCLLCLSLCGLIFANWYHAGWLWSKFDLLLTWFMLFAVSFGLYCVGIVAERRRRPEAPVTPTPTEAPEEQKPQLPKAEKGERVLKSVP